MQCVNAVELREVGISNVAKSFFFFILAKELCEYLASSPALREKRAGYAPSTHAPDLSVKCP